MACRSCGGNSGGSCKSCSRPKKTKFCSDCMPWTDKWLVAVDKVPDAFDADINHAYITPDNKVYVLAHDRMSMVLLNKDGEGLDKYLTKSDAEKTYQKALSAGDNIKIEGNKISAIVPKYDDSDLKKRITTLETKPDKDTTYKAGANIKISSDNTISAVMPEPKEVDLSGYVKKVDFDQLKTDFNNLKSDFNKLIKGFKDAGAWENGFKPGILPAYGNINLFGGTPDGDSFIRTNNGRTENDLTGGI